MSRKIFLSYRRKGEGAGFALALQHQLQEILGRRSVYLDTAEEAIALGEVWRQRLERAILASDTVLAIIDSSWSPRLAQHDDPVRFELETAVRSQRRIVPVLVGGASIPPAKDLPQALQSLPSFQAHEIRASSSGADTTSLIRKLTGRTPGEPVSTPDKFDAAAAAGLLLLGILVWASWGREQFNLAERWLFGALVVLGTLTSFVARRVASTWRSKWPAPARNRAIALTTLTALAWIVLAVAARWAYRVPTFEPDAAGLLIARFAGDPADGYQRALNESLSRRLSARRLDDRGVAVLVLPRRVSDDATAKAYGLGAGASVVLWGQAATQRTGTGGTIDARISFVGVEGAFEGGSEYIRGAFGFAKSPLDDVKLTGHLALLQEVLPPLLAGYRLYRADSSTPDNYAKPLALFDDALDVLSRERDPLESNHLRALFATLQLYRGNIFYLRHENASAEQAFQAAIEASKQPPEQVPWFLEPVNNLGLLYLQAGRIPDALKTLDVADRECRVPARALPPSRAVCPYALYNLAGVYLEMRRYPEAASRLAIAIETLEAKTDWRRATAVDQRFVAMAHQNTAFSRVMQSFETSEPRERMRLANDAEKEWKRGVDVLTRAKLPVPPLWTLTIARVHAARASWSAAHDVLRDLEKKKVANADVYLLLAAATWCRGQREASGGYLKRFQTLEKGSNQLAGILLFETLTEECH